MATGNKNRWYITRGLRGEILDMNKHYPCVLITGSRQVGKSTLLQQIMPKGMRYLSMDDEQLADYAQRDPAGFLESFGTPLCIDEVQYVPKLFRAIKARVDADRHAGLYWLTGSQRYLMMKGVSESLAGRIGIADMYTLSQNEAYGNGKADGFNLAAPAKSLCKESVCDIPELYARIMRGGYPELFRDPSLETGKFFRNYVNTYVKRDVHDLVNVGDDVAFTKFMRAAALRTGQQLVYADLAKSADVSPKTAASWISILVASGIVELVQPYYVNTTKRLAKTPKLYFMDTGLCCHLAGWKDLERVMVGPNSGPILETWVYGQMVRRYANAGTPVDIYYYRNQDNKAEVDFVIEENDRVYPMEVKRTATPLSADLRHCPDIPVGPGGTLMPPILFCTVKELLPMAHKALAFPISAL
ncbi:MAG: ATP-binding protein [Akkermansia sp.]|nr:ATP-binding protein [Akkermansia sp.]